MQRLPQACKAPALKAQAGGSSGNIYCQAEPLSPGGNDLVLVKRNSLPKYSTSTMAPILCRPAADGFCPAADAGLMKDAGSTAKCAPCLERLSQQFCLVFQLCSTLLICLDLFVELIIKAYNPPVLGRNERKMLM